MRKRNYFQELSKILLKIEHAETPPRLLLHACCAPCSSAVLEFLSNYFAITVFYYNPNISPRAEYEHRVQELKRFVREFKTKFPVEFLEGTYDPNIFLDAARGFESEKEGGARCKICFRLRLQEAARVAKSLGCEYFTTTLSISPLKNAEILNEIGEAEALKVGISHLPSDFKKKNGYKRSIELSKEYGLYRQNYCGCVYSKKEALEREEKRRELCDSRSN